MVEIFQNSIQSKSKTTGLKTNRSKPLGQLTCKDLNNSRTTKDQNLISPGDQHQSIGEKVSNMEQSLHSEVEIRQQRYKKKSFVQDTIEGNINEFMYLVGKVHSDDEVAQ